MKTLPLLILACGLATSVAIGQTTTAAPKVGVKTTDQIAKDAKAAKDAKDAKTAKDAKGKKKEEPMGKIEGIEIPRPNHHFLGIRVVDGVFRLTFYNEKRKPEAPDVARAVLRWDAKYKVGEERTVLNPGGDEHSLTSPKVIRPPLSFKLFITLLAAASDGTEAASETYTIDFRQ